MKYLIIFTVIVLILAFVFVLIFTDWIIPQREYSQDEIPEEVIDGHRKDNSNVSAQKSVESNRIIDFSLEFSTLSWADDQYFREGIYRLEAKKTDEKVYVKYEFNPYYGDREVYEAEADENFLISLDKSVKEYGIPEFNGKDVFVSGLPDMYGERISILYESGETVYASDNQDGFICRDAFVQIEMLFAEATKTE